MSVETHEVWQLEATQHLIEKMKRDGAPEEAVTQVLSMLLEMSTRLLYQDLIKIHSDGLTCETAKGTVELKFGTESEGEDS